MPFAEGCVVLVRGTPALGRLTSNPPTGGTHLSGPVRNFSEGRARRVRCTRLDHPSRFVGHDKHAPPALGGTRLSGPPRNVCLSIAIHRARQACPSNPWRDLLVRSVALSNIISASMGFVPG